MSDDDRMVEFVDALGETNRGKQREDWLVQDPL